MGATSEAGPPQWGPDGVSVCWPGDLPGPDPISDRRPTLRRSLSRHAAGRRREAAVRQVSRRRVARIANSRADSAPLALAAGGGSRRRRRSGRGLGVAVGQVPAGRVGAVATACAAGVAPGIGGVRFARRRADRSRAGRHGTVGEVAPACIRRVSRGRLDSCSEPSIDRRRSWRRRVRGRRPGRRRGGGSLRQSDATQCERRRGQERGNSVQHDVFPGESVFRRTFISFP